MPRPILATIDSAAIAHNLERARSATRDANARLWAVIKANAYGHGIERIYAGLSGADGLAMLDFDEALRVRALGWTQPILMLEGCFGVDDYATVFAHNLTVVIHQFEQIDWLRSAVSQFGYTGRVDVYLKLNTDMNRVGLSATDFASAHEQLLNMPVVAHISLMTHFANADLEAGADSAWRQFGQVSAPILECQPQTECCLSNSAAVLSAPVTHGQWVRPGIMIYGGSPFADKSAADCGLRPAMTLSTRVIATRSIAAGQAIGYGSSFVAPHDMRIGVIACGYADGYPRHAPDGTPIVVAGVRTRLIGRVSMDMMMVDLTPIPNAQIGTEVELWGAQLPIDEVAQAAGTIGYELMCALSNRVPVQVLPL